MVPTTYSVKLFANGDVRRFECEGISFQYLKQKCIQVANLMELYGEDEVLLKYEDKEKDKVTFSSDVELQYALSHLENNLLRLHLEVVKQVNVPPQVPCHMSWRAHKDAHLAHKIHKAEMKHAIRGGETETPTAVAVKKIKELDARFISHQTCPDDTEIQVGQTFQKTWRFRNTGTLRWPTGTIYLRVDRADELSAPISTPVASIGPEEETDVTVTMTAPLSPGRYQSYFKLCSPIGKKFGQRMRCQILAVSATSISPERMDKVWESLEAMGFVLVGQRPNNISSLIVKENCDITRIVRILVGNK